MRVAHVITRLIVGGAQENTISSVLGLRNKPDVDVSLVSGPSEGPEGSLEATVDQIPGLLKIVPELTRPLNPLKDAVALRKLIKLFKITKPDVVHTHSGKAGFLGRLAAARAGVRAIVHTIHGPSFGRFQGKAPNLIFGFAEKMAGRHTHHFVCVAEAMKRQYLQAGIGRPEMFSVVRSGFDTAPYIQARNDSDFRATLGLKPDHIVVGKIARLFKLKGHEDLITVAPEVVRQNPAIRFLLVGDGAWRHRFEQMASQLGVRDYFIFCGLIPPEAVPRYVGVMDLLVHLSSREGLPRALPQALAAGKAVVAYDCDGANEVCLHGKTGLLVPAGDRRLLKESLLTLAGSPEQRKQLGDRGRALVLEEFAVEPMVNALYTLYRRLTSMPRDILLRAT